MNELIAIMAGDMNICHYAKETEGSFAYRVIYSALGLWCLKSALREKENKKGISRQAQCLLLHGLFNKYIELCPMTKCFFPRLSNTNIEVFIRNIYEQTGYLLTDGNNYNILNNSGEAVRFSDADYLYLGLMEKDYTINGLGIHCKSSKQEIKLCDFLVRDNLTPEEYIKVNYDECDFEEKDIEEELEFFNPFYYGNVSNSWNRQMKSDITMARSNRNGPYYRVIRKEAGKLLYANDNSVNELDNMTGAEFRRIYVALKHHYDNPMQLLICPIDGEYSYIRILGQLPNREYYYLLMNAWPRYSFADRNNFIIRNQLIVQLVEVLEAIGFTARNGEFYG